MPSTVFIAALFYAQRNCQALARVFGKYCFKDAYVPKNKLKQKLAHVKYPLELWRFPEVICKTLCKDCYASGIGETENFKRRIQQRRNDVRKGNVSLNASAHHHFTSNHGIDWHCASTVTTEKRPSTRLPLESVHIQTTKNAINRSRGNLPEIYIRTLRHPIHI